MQIPGSLALKLCLCVAATVPFAGAATAPTLSASPSTVIFQYSPQGPVPVPVFVTITASDGSSPVLQAAITPGAGTPAALFPTPAITGNQMQVYFNIQELYQLVAGIYTATVTVTASGFTPLQVPVTFNISSTLSVFPVPTSLTFTVPGTTVQTIQLGGTGSSAIAFTLSVSTTNGQNWLTAAASTLFTPALLTVTVNPSTLPAGNYQGSITINAQVGGPVQIPVTLVVGLNPLTATPTSFSFSYSQAGTIPPAQIMQLTTSAANDTYIAGTTSAGNWLLVNGGTSNVSGSLPANVNVTVNPAGLGGGTYHGTITVTDSNGGMQTVNATLVVTGLSTVVNPDTLVFVAQAGQSAPAPQTVYIEALGSSTFSATVNGAWLSLSSLSGPAPAQLMISVNPNGLQPGMYNGSVDIDVETHTQLIEVTLIVSANPVLTVNVGSFIFSYQGGSSPGLPETLAVGVSSGEPLTYSIAAGMPSWLQVSPPVGNTSILTPTNLSVTLAPQTLPTGTYLAQIILTPSGAGAVAVVVPVLLIVNNAPAVVPNVTSLTFTGAAGQGPQAQTVQLSASAETAFTAAVTTSLGGTWLSVSPTSGEADLTTNLTVTADATSLASGAYQGTVTLTTSGGVVSQIGVTFTVTGTVAPLTVSPTSLTFAYTQNGSLPGAQSVQVTGSESFVASASTGGGGSWLAVSPASGTNNVTLSVSVTPATLAPGTYNGTVTVSPAGGSPQTVTVTLYVYAPSTLAASPDQLSFVYNSGGSLPPAQNVAVSSAGAAASLTATASSSGWLSVSPTSAVTPATLSISANPANLAGGTYNGTVILTGGSGSLNLSIQVTLSVVVTPPDIQSVVNGASYLSGSIAPGELVTVFGSGMGPSAGLSATVDSKGYIETSLAGVTVTFNGYPGPILYAGAGQINTIVPYELTGATNATVEVMFGTARSNTLTVAVAPAAPGVFSADASGQGPGAILDLNYHLVSSTNPVSIGQTIQIFATGDGQTNPAGVDGLIEPDALPLPLPLLPYGVSIGNVPAVVSYFGAAPGLVAGAVQINAVIPEGVLPGAQPLIISVYGFGSQPGITVEIQ